MAGTPLKNLRMFEELCGKNTFQNVILATTMWDEVDKETGEARENELKKNYWQTMLELNSTTSRFMRTRQSAFELINPLIDAANERISIQLQQEMVDMRKKLPLTSAGQKLFSEMEVLVRKREELLHRIRNEMKHANGDEMMSEVLQEEHQKIQLDLESTVNEMRRLKLPLVQRLLDKFFSNRFKSFMSMISNRLSKDPNGDRPQSESEDQKHQAGPDHSGHTNPSESTKSEGQQDRSSHKKLPQSDEKSQQQAEQAHSPSESNTERRYQPDQDYSGDRNLKLVLYYYDRMFIGCDL